MSTSNPQRSLSPSPTFIGFRVKRVVPTPDWLKAQGGETTRVEEICSVSDCMSEPPPGWVDRWDFNPACCYNSELAAWATVPAGEESLYRLFAYRMFPVRYASDGQHAIDVHAEWEWKEESIPVEQGMEAYTEIGYDVAGGGTVNGMICGFHCSPLSCNGLAAEHRVNRYCLFSAVQEAMAAAARFALPYEAEPGPYYVYQVFRRRFAVGDPEGVNPGMPTA